MKNPTLQFSKNVQMTTHFLKQLRLLLLLFPVFSFAWNSEGHSTGGAIAYYYLKATNPKAIDKVLLALTSHPWYNLKGDKGWADKLAPLNDEQKKVMLFMLASTFPDDARNTVYDRPSWHYINYAFVPFGETVQPVQSPAVNAESMIIKLQNDIKTESDPIKNALDICWLFHLIEDVHQPLHSTGMFDKNHPNGDQGGNLTYMQFSTGGPVKLHSYWDGLIKTSIPNAPALAQSLLQNPEYSVTNLIELNMHPDPHGWVFLESFELAKSECYLNGKVVGTETAPTKVADSYGANASKVAEKRIVLAGIRLGQTLGTVMV